MTAVKNIQCKLHRLLKPVKFCFVFIFICFWQTTHAQYERIFNDSLNDDFLLTETYDGCVLVQGRYDSAIAPTYLIKYGLEGKALWKIQLKNAFWVNALATKDSGFIITSTVLINTTNPDSGNIALVKFDKCCQIQWARYVSGPRGSSPLYHNPMIEEGGHFYLLGYNITTTDNNHRLPITVLKFSKNGNLVNYKFLPGDNSRIYNSTNGDTIYIDQDMSIPLAGDTNSNMFYAYSGIHAMDTSLNDAGQTLPGYPGTLNGMGSLIVKNNGIQAITVSLQPLDKTMLTDWNKSLLSTKKKPYYDSLANYYLDELDASALNDSIIVVDFPQRKPLIPSYFYISLRLYNDTLKLLKKYDINKGNKGQTSPSSFLRLQNGNIIVSALNYNDTTNQVTNTSFYLFDRKLDPLIWPTSPPAKGYDWACNKSIPPTQVIYLNSIVKPVNVIPDTSFVDWNKLIKSGIPENAIIARIENGWLTWPQPITNGSPLFLQLQSNNSLQNFKALAVIFYDMEGKQVLQTTAMYQSASKWVIPSLNLPCAGVYMAQLRNKHTGQCLGNMKVVVE